MTALGALVAAWLCYGATAPVTNCRYYYYYY